MIVTNNLFVPTWHLDCLLDDSTDSGIPNIANMRVDRFNSGFVLDWCSFCFYYSRMPIFLVSEWCRSPSLSVFHLCKFLIALGVPISANASTVLLRTYRFWSWNAWIRAFTAPTAPFPILLQLPQHHEPIHTDHPTIELYQVRYGIFGPLSYRT